MNKAFHCHVFVLFLLAFIKGGTKKSLTFFKCMPHSMHAKHRKYLVQYGSIVCGNPYCFFYELSITERKNVLSLMILEIEHIQKARLLQSI